MGLYNAMDEKGTARRKKGVDRLKVAQVAAHMLEQLVGPGGGGSPTPGRPIADPVRPAASQPPVPSGVGQLASAVPGPKLPAMTGTPAPPAPVAPALKNVSGGPKAPAGVTADQLHGYDKYQGSALDALARRLARQKAGIHLGGPDNKQQAAKAVALGLLPGSEQNARRPLRRRKAMVA